MARQSRPKDRRPSKPHGVREYVITAALSLLLIWLLLLNFSIFRKERIAQSAAHDTQAELASLSVREKALEANTAELATERGQEATLRDTLGVAKPGEGVIIVVPTQQASSTPPVSFWQKWFGWLKFW